MRALPPPYQSFAALFASYFVFGCQAKPVPDPAAGTAPGPASAAVSATAHTTAGASTPKHTASVAGGAPSARKGEWFRCSENKLMEGIGLAGASGHELDLGDGASAQSIAKAVADVCSRDAKIEACVQAERLAKRKVETTAFTLSGRDGVISSVQSPRTELADCVGLALAGAATGGATELRYTYVASQHERFGPALRTRDGKGTGAATKLPPEVIARIVRGRAGAMRACHKLGLAANPKLVGTVTFELSLDAKGTATSVVASQDKLGDPNVTACLVSVAKDLTFPVETKGAKAGVTYVVELVID